MARYQDLLPTEDLNKIFDKVSKYKDDGGRLDGTSVHLRNRLMHEFRREIHRKVYDQVFELRARRDVNTATFAANLENFKQNVMQDLDSPDPKVREAARKKMRKMKLLDPLQAKVGGLETFAESGNVHFSAIRNQKQGQFFNGYRQSMRPDTFKAFSSGEFDLDVAKAVFDLGNRKSISHLNPMVQEMAVAVHKANKSIVAELEAAGVWIPERNNYIMKQTHDQGRLMDAGKQAWTDRLMQEGVLDKELTFGDVKDLKEQIKILDDIYDDILSGQYGETSAGAFTGSRGIHFASPDSFVKYNKEFGRGNMHLTMVESMRSASKSFALTETFGNNPQKYFDIMVDEITKDLSKTAKKELLDSNFFGELRSIQDQFKEVTSYSNYTVSGSKLAQTLRTTRTLLSAAKLKFSVFSTATDVTFGKLIGTTGVHIDRMQSIADFAKMAASSKDRAMWETRLDMFFGDMAQGADKYGAFDNAPGKINNFTRKYVMPLNGMDLQNKSAKLTWGKQVSLGLVENAKKSFADSDPRFQNTLKRYGISEKEWDFIRSNIDDIGEGVKAVTPDGIRKAGGSPKTASKVAMLINGLATDIGSPQASIKDVAKITRGTAQGSIEREMLLSLGQFKSFALTIPRVIKRALYNNPDAAGKDVVQALMSQGNMQMMGAFMAEMTMISAAAITAKSVITKNETPNFQDPKFWVDAFQRGAMPMFASSLIDIAKGEYAQFGRSMFKDLAGPTVGEIDTMVRVLSGAAKGDPDWAKGADLIMQYLPGNQLMYIAPMGIHSFAQQLKEMQNPGYLDRLERRNRGEGITPFFQ